jgi:hypothetical protein
MRGCVLRQSYQNVSRETFWLGVLFTVHRQFQEGICQSPGGRGVGGTSRLPLADPLLEGKGSRIIPASFGFIKSAAGSATISSRNPNNHQRKKERPFFCAIRPGMIPNAAAIARNTSGLSSIYFHLRCLIYFHLRCLYDIATLPKRPLRFYIIIRDTRGGRRGLLLLLRRQRNGCVFINSGDRRYFASLSLRNFPLRLCQWCR